MTGSELESRLLSLCLAVALIACGDNSPDCSRLFGAPSANSGMSAEQCRPSCVCDGFTPPSYGEAEIASLDRRELVDEFPLLAESPYDSPADHPGKPHAFCAVVPIDSTRYRLETFVSLEAVAAAGATVTHYGACGRCSPLQDLAVYLRNPDLAGPVRECGLDTTGGGEPANTACLMDRLGFTRPCAQIWAYNTINTREHCLAVCFAALGDPYHDQDGSLNPCIQCDEDESGPVFKAVAGRTRRNSGLPSALCRPCDSVAPVIHDYD